jgi:hypothetical protein
MSDIQITVSEVRWPAQGKKVGSIIDQTGKYWGAFPDKLSSFTVGGTYRILDYSTFQGKNGQTYYTIREFQPLGGAIQNSQQNNGARTPPPPARPMGPAPDDNQRRMDIYICGSFNNWLRTADPTSSMMDYVDQLHKFKSAWLAVFGPSPLPPRQAAPVRQDPISSGPDNSDMNDDIPF